MVEATDRKIAKTDAKQGKEKKGADQTRFGEELENDVVWMCAGDFAPEGVEIREAADPDTEEG